MDHREAYGVEPICRVLPIAPSAYHEHVARAVIPSACSIGRSDAVFSGHVRGVFEENYGV